jgi:hypothetical protein
MIVKKIDFKLEIDNIPIYEYYIDDKGHFNFKINDYLYKNKEIQEKYGFNIICENCGFIRNFNNINAKLKTNKKFNCKSCRMKGDKNPMYGKKHNAEVLEKLRNRLLGEKNHFYGKKHTEEAKIKMRNSKLGKYDGDKNPMYGKKYFDVWVEKYGVECSLSRLEERNKKCSERMKGSGNPMYGKKYFDVWVEKYGIDGANERFIKMSTKIKENLKRMYAENPEIRDKISKALKNRIFTEKHRQNLRKSTIKYLTKKLSRNGGKLVPNFNFYACELLDEIARIKNIKIQHALNGGEFYIKELGYWVDGYDKENNVVYEYYEKEHKSRAERDTNRENQIKNFLKCEFIIIHENKEEEFLKTII